MMNIEALCLVPPALVVILGVVTRRSLESLLLGCIVGALLIDWHSFPGNFLSLLTETLSNTSLVWVIMVCGAYGMLIQMIVASGSAIAFGDYMLKWIKTKKSALISTWLTGIIVFADDYLSALSTGVSMRKITDKYGVSRPLLAYIVNTTAAPVCAIIPISTWGIFSGKLLEDAHLIPPGQGLIGFAKTIPFNFFAIFSLLIALGVALNWIPLLGKMKQYQQEQELRTIQFADQQQEEKSTSATPLDFLFPMLVLIGGTIWMDGDALKGAATAFAATLLWYSFRKVLPYATLSDQAVEGFKIMVMPLSILTLSFLLKAIGDKMGLTVYVIDALQHHFPPQLLPVSVFLMLALISYTTCSSWGLYTVALPIIIPLSSAMHLNPYLMVGAVIGAGVFGSNASFFSDCTILTATSTECSTTQHSFSQLPYALLSLSIAAVLYLIGGFIF